MRFSPSAIALATTFVSSTSAFKDTSPFLMFSNSPLPASMKDISKSQLQLSSTVLQSAKTFLSSCPSQIYYVISQPSITSNEVSTSMHHLKMAVGNPAVKTRVSVNEVAGFKEGDAESLKRYIETTCGATVVNGKKSVDAAFKAGEGKSVVVEVGMGGVEGTAEQRALGLSDNDSDLFTSVLADLPKGYKYTVIFTTTPATSLVSDSHKAIIYNPEFQEAFHMDLKRDTYTYRTDNETNSKNFRPLFEKYNFFSPGLFMGLSVSIVLLAILYVGISAVASLEVSYGAFDKEMGPAAQKKAS